MFYSLLPTSSCPELFFCIPDFRQYQFFHELAVKDLKQHTSPLFLLGKIQELQNDIFFQVPGKSADMSQVRLLLKKQKVLKGMMVMPEHLHRL